MTDYLYRIIIRILPDLIYQYPDRVRGGIITCIVPSHSISNSKEVREISNCVLGSEHIILVHLPLHSYIRS